MVLRKDHATSSVTVTRPEKSYTFVSRESFEKYNARTDLASELGDEKGKTPFVNELLLVVDEGLRVSAVPVSSDTGDLDLL